jgi:hypothetical protein
MRHIIKKADGSEEPFFEGKLLSSLGHVGVQEQDRSKILNEVLHRIQSKNHAHETTTSDIYEETLSLLKETSGAMAARYSIKRAVLALGPSGFPFERYIAEVLKAHGAKAVKTDVILNGMCVPHEVDVVATLNGKRIGIESKFHNSLGIKTDIKDMLYVHARYHDLTSARNAPVDEGWLVTNTRFTSQATQYAMCSGMKAIGWDYPKNLGIQKLIESAGLHPITSLVSLTTEEHQSLLKRNIVLVRDIAQNPKYLSDIGIYGERAQAISDEAAAVSVSRGSISYTF